MKKPVYFVLAAGLMAGLWCVSAQGQDTVTLRTGTIPSGVWSGTETFYAKGLEVEVPSAPVISGSYRFTYWEVDGERIDDSLGRSLNPISVTLNQSREALAHYLPANEDSDQDELPDALEIEYFGDLTRFAYTDDDEDGFDLMTELSRDYHPRTADVLAEGGQPSRRSGAVLLIIDTNYVTLEQVSEPSGIIDQTDLLPSGTTVTLLNPPASSQGYRFTGLFFNGERIDSAATIHPLSLTLNASTRVVARYTAENADSDNDTVPDHFELFYDNSLSSNAASDADADGFDYLTELSRGYSPLTADAIVEGGIPVRRSDKTLWSNNQRFYQWLSNPAGLLAIEGLGETGETVTTPDLWADARNGHRFAYWEVDGETRRDAYGIAVSQLSMALAVDVQTIEAVARFFPEDEDSDGDGVPDWFELVYYTSLAFGAESDSDGDGFTLAQELLAGYFPLFHDEILEGGISRRRSSELAILLNIIPWGANDKKQLEIPDSVGGLNLADLIAGQNHTIALADDGQLVSWGDDSFGKLEPPPDIGPVRRVAAGFDHNLALLEDGSLVGWGRNHFKQASPPPNLRNVKAIACGFEHSLAVTEEGKVIVWGRNRSTTNKPPRGLSDVIAVAGGGNHSLALKSDGTVVAWGDNSYGQLDIPPGLSNVIMVACGKTHSLALRRDGTLVAWGGNDLGQLQVPARVAGVRPGRASLGSPQKANGEILSVVEITAGENHSLALMSDGSVEAWGANNSGQSAVPDDLTGVIAVRAGSAHSIALKALGQPEDPANPRYTLTLEDNHGAIMRSPFRTTYMAGEQVTLTAQPDPGWMFSHWEEDLNGSQNPQDLSIDGDHTVRAVFTLDPDARFTLDLAIAHGSIVATPDKADYAFGESVTLEAFPLPGYQFTSWDGDVIELDNPLTLTITQNLSLEALLQQTTETCAMNLVAHHGEIQISPSRADYFVGETITLRVRPHAGFRFAAWGGDLTTNDYPLTVTLGETLNLRAFFAHTYLLVRMERLSAQRRGMALRLPTIEGQTYRVQISDDLQNWFDYGPNHNGDGSELQVEIELGEESRKFSRIVHEE